MNLHDFWNLIAPYAIPAIATFLVGLVLKSPLGKYVPTSAARVAANLKPETVQAVVKTLQDPATRRALAIRKLQELASREGVAIEDELAGRVIDGLVVMYAHVIDDVKRLRK